MDMVQSALYYAIRAHKGQVDKGGNDYINHPVYLALQMDTPVEKSVALLHDVLEDSDVLSYDDIYHLFNPYIADTVQLLTREDNEKYFDYIKRIKSSNNDVAIKVKIADLNHNSDLSRISIPTEKDYKRVEKYKNAIKILTD